MWLKKEQTKPCRHFVKLIEKKEKKKEEEEEEEMEEETARKRKRKKKKEIVRTLFKIDRSTKLNKQMQPSQVHSQPPLFPSPSLLIQKQTRSKLTGKVKCEERMKSCSFCFQFC